MVDPESGIRQYAIAIGLSPTDQSVLSKTTLSGGQDLSYFTSALLSPLDHTLPHYIVLFATNGANLEGITVSDPVRFDISSPIISEGEEGGGVLVHPNFRVASYVMDVLSNVSSAAESAICLLDTDVVSISFSAPQDPKSDDAGLSYEIGIGLTPGADDLMRYESFIPISLPGPNNGGSSSLLYHRLHPLDFADAGRRGVYFSVRVRNAVGRCSTLTSNPVFIKSTLTRQLDWIWDGVGSDSDLDYQTSTVEIGAIFFFGVNCPIRQGRWAVEGVDGNLTQPYTDLDPFQYQNPLGNVFRVTSDQVVLYEKETYRVLVQVTDYSGEVHILRSDGVTVTTRALKPGLVRDGVIPDQDLNYQESVTSLSASWSGFGDGTPEQELAYYEVAAGSDRQWPNTRSDIAPFTHVGLDSSHTFADLRLSPDHVRYFFTVRAYAVSGAYAEVSSNGISVGFRHSIVPGVILLPHFQSDVTTLAAHWTEFESSVPIRQYEWALGSEYFNDDQVEEFCLDSGSNHSEAFDVSGFTAVGLDTYVAVRGIALRDNTTYYFTLRALDQANRCTVVTSPMGVTIDQTPPTGPPGPTGVVLGPMESRREGEEGFVVYVRAGEQLRVEWDAFLDEESGVDCYEVGFFQQLACGNNSILGEAVVDFMRITGEEREAVFTGLPLSMGVSYVGVVRATNRAGVTGYAYSEPVVLDDWAPRVGVVRDGEEWGRDLAYQSNLSMLSAVFTHAQLPSEADIEEVPEGRPCPTREFNLTEWTPLPSPVRVSGYTSSSITYLDSHAYASDESQQLFVDTSRDLTSTIVEVLSGSHQTRVDLSKGGIVQADIVLASGNLPEFQMNAVTSLLFIDSGTTSDVLAVFQEDAPEFAFDDDSPPFRAFGLQLYKEFVNATTSLPQRVILWAANAHTLGQPIHVSRDLSGVDLDIANRYRIEFEEEQLDTELVRTAHLYVNEILMASLHGLPPLSNHTRVVFHTFNRQGYVPPPTDPPAPIMVQASLANVSLPLLTGHLCDYGEPFHTRGSPVVEFRAWAGSRAGLDDVQEAKVSSQCTNTLLIVGS